MDSTYYREYFELERNHWWFRARSYILEQFLLKKLPKQPLTILNVGVSTGHTSEMLSRFGNVTSIEYDADCIAYTKSKIDLEIIHGSILELPFEANHFDVVCAFDVVEHVDDDSKAVYELKRVCKENGFVFLTVPAFMFLWNQHDEVNHHFRRYRKNELNRLFGTSGKLQFSSYYNFWLFFVIAPLRLLFKMMPFLLSKRKGSGSDFSSPLDQQQWKQNLLFNLFKSESKLLNAGIRFPFGVSIFSCWQKVSKN
jgi:SAM-dependent methyltransferase